MNKIAMFLATLVLCHPALAQEHSDSHDKYHTDFYSKWQRPNGLGSCCDARVDDKDGHQLSGHCYETDAEVVNGLWVAKLRGGGTMVIPEKLVIHEINPNPAKAHICHQNSTLYCFVPPGTGM